MRRRSLRLRLLAGAAVAFFAALALCWLGLTVLFERHIQRRETGALIHAADTLLAGLAVGRDGAPLAESQPDDQRFGDLAGGRYWQLSTDSGVLQSASLWDQRLPLPGDAVAGEWRTRRIEGPFQERLLVVYRFIRPEKAAAPVLVQLAENDDELQLAGSEFRSETAVFLAFLWLVLSAAAYVQVELGLRPLAHLRQQLVRLQKSPSARLGEEFPDEILPLIHAINALAGSREADLARARRRAADLAHSLKTPLSVVTAQSRRARLSGASEAAEGMDRAIAAMAAALETELARSRAAAARSAAEVAEASPLAVAEGLVAVIERTEHGDRIVFDIGMEGGLTAPIASEDLAELLGALVENAARHARRLVRIGGKREADGTVLLTVEDDGPGIEDTRAATALLRGGRLDEAGAGHGLGLAIVRDLAEATEGTVALDRSALGGLRVRLSWETKAGADREPA